MPDHADDGRGEKLINKEGGRKTKNGFVDAVHSDLGGGKDEAGSTAGERERRIETNRCRRHGDNAGNCGGTGGIQQILALGLADQRLKLLRVIERAELDSLRVVQYRLILDEQSHQIGVYVAID